MSVRSRRRRRAPLAVRVRRLWVVGAFVLLAFAAVAYVLITASTFRVGAIGIDGAAVVPKSTILAQANIDRDANVWLLPKRAIEARVRAIPLIDTAALVRSLPNGLRIVVTERTPTACVAADAGIVTIDAARRVLYAKCNDDLPRFTIASGESLAPGGFLRDRRLVAFQRDAERIASGGLHLAALRDDRFGGLEATLRDGLLVQFGSDVDLEAKLPIVQPVLASVRNERGRVAAVDLRAPGTPVVRYR